MIRIERLSALVAIAFGAAVLAVVPARAEDQCNELICVHIEDIGNPEYLHFYVYRPGSDCAWPTHFNMLDRGSQSELANTNCRSPRTYIRAKPGSSHVVSFQACKRRELESNCGPWLALTLVKPAAAEPWAAIAVDGKGRWGYAVGQPSPDVAKNAALQGCGDSACTILDALQASCIAYAESREGGYWYFGFFGPNEGAVQSNAMNACYKAAPTGSCKLVQSVCG